MKNKDLDNILDQVAAGIRADQADTTVVNDAAERVWERLSTDADARIMRADRPLDHPSTAAALGIPVDAGAPVADRIEGCTDFQSLIPAYLGGELSEARSLLLVDHTHECIPCRKALKQAREGRVADKPGRTANVPARRLRSNKYSLRPVVLRWGIAAALLIGLGLIALPLIQRYVP